MFPCSSDQFSLAFCPVNNRTREDPRSHLFPLGIQFWKALVSRCVPPSPLGDGRTETQGREGLFNVTAKLALPKCSRRAHWELNPLQGTAGADCQQQDTSALPFRSLEGAYSQKSSGRFCAWGIPPTHACWVPPPQLVHECSSSSCFLGDP